MKGVAAHQLDAWAADRRQHLSQGQVMPQAGPQSPPSSSPFCTASRQVGAWHLPILHTADAQSACARQPRPSGQGPQVEVPPQSTPLSAPFWRPSKQVGARQRFGEPAQTPETQSRSSLHALSFGQGRLQTPPQSTAGSLGSSIWFPQVVGAQ